MVQLKTVRVPKHWLWVFLIASLLLCNQTAVAQTTNDGTITGTVRNGTTDKPAPEGTEVILYAYNSSYTRTETMTTTLDADGRFQFSLTDQPDDWVYLASTTYQELSFSSNIASLTSGQPLDLSLTVYEPTSDPADVVIDQLRISLEVVGQEVQVQELYVMNNEGTAVFTGSGDSGTVQFNLPANAQAITFERGMGPNSGFFPTSDVIQQDGRWVDTIALRPGPNSLTLRVTYQLPPADRLDLSRQLPYQTNNITVALPDDGLTFAADGWQQQSTQSVGEKGVILSYAQSDLAKESQLSLTFSGSPTPLQSTSLTTSSTGDWIISLGILLLVTFVGFRLLRPKARPAMMPQLATAGTAPSPSKNDKAERWQLLFALADLDNAYKNGKLSEAEYQQQRQEIKAHLRSIWEIE
ncbi:MAG: hypothetical protein CL608_00195 [Anaerolineaceae bacterium]|nr:hypothetical protein [Anaerolineaceae bacterium]